MADPGEYGDLSSRAAFRARVGELARRAATVAKKHPDLGEPLTAIKDELEAMARATANGRDPEPGEREELESGLIAIRELEGAPDEDVTDFADAIHPVVAFYEDWPTDEEAAAAAAG